MFGWEVAKCAAKLYFQTAGEEEEQSGHWMGTFEQGELAVDSEAFLYCILDELMQPFDALRSI